jgi:type VI secretion system ImpC/EvpB family protein
VKHTAAMLDAMIVGLELQIERSLSSILHHPEFRALEARWAGLRLLVESVPDEFVEDVSEDHDSIVVSIWNVSKSELAEDLRDARSPTTTALYQEVYQRSFNTAGGQPFGIILGDYSFSDHPSDVALLRDIGTVCDTAFSPFVAAAAPEMFHIEHFSQLYALIRSDVWEKKESLLSGLFREPTYVDWNGLRRSFAARFIVLALPRFLMRRSYDPGRFLGRRARWYDSEQPHPYHEKCAASESVEPLWGNPAFALGEVVLRSFARSGWLADIHGLPAAPSRAGVVPLVVCDEFPTDEPGLFPKFSTEIMITDELEKELSALGFVCLCDRYPSPCAFFGSTPTICEPEEMNEAGANISQRMSSMLQYMLCACRFAHYIKRIGHDRVGTTGTADDYERTLHNFLIQFVLEDENAPAELKARQPLSDAHVRVSPLPVTGEYHCEIMLKPHYELDAVEVRLETEIVGREIS